VLTLVLEDRMAVDEGRLKTAISFVLGVPPAWCNIYQMAVLAPADGPSRVRASVAVPAAARESALELAVKFRTFLSTRPIAFDELLGAKVQAAEVQLDDGDPLPLAVTIVPQSVDPSADSRPKDTQPAAATIVPPHHSTIDKDRSAIFAAVLIGFIIVSVACIVVFDTSELHERFVNSKPPSSSGSSSPSVGEAEKKMTQQLLLPDGASGWRPALREVAPKPPEFAVSV
jgi:hypothetical protein